MRVFEVGYRVLKKVICYYKICGIVILIYLFIRYVCIFVEEFKIFVLNGLIFIILESFMNLLNKCLLNS